MKRKHLLFAVVFSSLVASAFLLQGTLSIEEGFGASMPCITGETKPCGSNIGVCEQGTRSCIDGKWGECKGGTSPAEEICNNNLDDDCNGMVDDCAVVPGGFGTLLITGGVMLLILATILAKIS